LQVPRTASDEEVKQAYRRLARQHHPDLYPEKEKELHTHEMREINEAYAVLGSKENRAKYDQYGEHWKEGPPPRGSVWEEYSPGNQGASRFSGQSAEAFSDFFRNMFRQGGREEAEELFPSELDIEAEIDISLEEAVKGAEKTLRLMTTGLCPNCHGTGRKNKVFCRVCGGVGEIRREREIKAKIPAGLIEGSRIRLKGQGNEGTRTRGDLYLRVHLIADPRFKIEGKDLETTARIMPWQAALGSQISVQTLEGSLRVRIPQGTHAGQRLRVAGRGLGKLGARGDLFVRIEIDVPTRLSPKAETRWKQLEEEAHERIF